MQDGRIIKIRQSLDKEKLNHIAILAYTAKYASRFYRPFREAINASGLKKSPQNKRSYQMAITNSDEAIHAAIQHLNEGADCLMVKPAMPYLDIISRIKTALYNHL